uniref:Uncharacterized protein n=1 Tax=Anguilla anguilla TaxID=7936 RepID=A0A0E9T9L5_ANGAN
MKSLDRGKDKCGKLPWVMQTFKNAD